MKTRLVVISLALGLIALAAGRSQAATAGTTAKVAKVRVGGDDTVWSFSLQIRQAADTTVVASSVQWNGVTAGETGWKIADHVLWINSTLMKLNSGIQIYTDNRGTGAVPTFNVADSTAPTSNAAGLLYHDGTGSTTRLPLPMAWSIKESTKVVELADVNRGIGATDPGIGSEGGFDTRYQWLYFADKTNVKGIDYTGDGDVNDKTDGQAFSPGARFVTMLNQPANSSAIGMHHSQGDEDERFGGSPNGIHWVYLEANFAQALPQKDYQTSKLTVEAFSE